MRISDQAYNRLKILKTIRGEGPISRTVLAARTGLSGGTITEVTAGLARRGLIVEQRLQPNGPGRPRVQLEINGAGGVVVGASIEPEGLHIVFVDLTGTTRFNRMMKLGTPRSYPDLASRIIDLIEEAIQAGALDRSQISRVAVSLQGVIDSHSGDVHWIATYPPGPYPIGKVIAQRMELPVTIDLDINCLARAEHWFGRAQSIDTFSVFFLDLAVGGAQYADGLLRASGNSLNSEIGHVKTDLSDNARPCFCGSAGCLTSYASMFGMLQGGGLLEDFTMDVLVGSTYLSLDALRVRFADLIELAESGDRRARSLFGTAGQHLGLAVANHISAYDPGHVLVLAQDQRFLDLLAPSLWATLGRAGFDALVDATRIELGTATEDWRGKGIAALALEQTYLGGGNGRSLQAETKSTRHKPASGNASS